MKQYDHQKSGVIWLQERSKALLLDEQGLGKTITGIMACIDFPILCIVPTVVLWNWEFEWRRWRPEFNIQVLDKGNCVIDDTNNVQITTHSLLLSHKLIKQLVKRKWGTLIIDEIQYFKNRTALRTKALYGMFGRPNRYALVNTAKNVWGFTGTIIPNDVSELWTHIWGFEPERLADKNGDIMNWQRFRRRYCVLKETQWGIKVIGNRNLDDLKKRMTGLTLRRLKKDCLSLPSIRYETIHLRPKVMPWKIKRLSHDIHRIIPDYKDELADDATAEMAFAYVSSSLSPEEFSRWRRISGVAKIDPVCELIKMEHDSGQLESCVIFAHHRQVIDGIVELLGPDKCIKITGSTPPKERNRLVKLFQARKDVPFAVCNIKAGGIGITLTKAKEVVFVELSVSPGDNAQAAERIHRIGQTGSKVRIRFVSLAGTIDEQIMPMVIRKTKMIREFMS